MNEPMHDVYESMVMAVARVGREVSEIDHALRAAIEYVAYAIPWIEDDLAEPAATRTAAHHAYLSVVALAERLRVPRADAVDGAEVAYAAVVSVLDALGPHVGHAERAVRAVLLDGEPLTTAARRLATA